MADQVRKSDAGRYGPIVGKTPLENRIRFELQPAQNRVRRFERPYVCAERVEKFDLTRSALRNGQSESEIRSTLDPADRVQNSYDNPA
jgi:hypothetical protein